MKLLQTLLIVVTSAIALSSCSKKDMNTTTAPAATPTTTVNKIAPDGFNYSTAKNVVVNVTALTNDNKPMPSVPMHIYTLNTDGSLGKMILTGFTDNAGIFNTTISVPAYCDTLVIDPAYIGLVRLAKATINGSNINCTIGGKKGYAGDIVSTMNTGSNLSAYHSQALSVFNTATVFGYTNTNTTKFAYMGKYDGMGRPLYLEPDQDIISADMLKAINTSLPEGKSVAVTHPQYITSGAASNIIITQLADVYLTFTYEGAGYKNSLGWYKYPTNNPPKTMNDIDSIHFVFDNCSLIGSGGDMQSGDKVKIGTFDKGTTIGLVLFADAWNGSAVNYYAGGVYFTDSYLNPEVNTDLKRHTVMLQYQNTYMIGFEDMNRESIYCDHDFNDVIVYATSNPIEAISNNNVQIADTPVDTDGDGVTDAFDAFPNDPTRAYINYFPAQNTWGTLAYEDQWPGTGDYDMNDLVVNYQYKIISNAKNNIVEMFGSFAPVASGAIYNNGFGVQFPFSPDLIQTVTGQNLKNGYIKTNANGTEAGQKNAVIIPFDNVHSMIRYADGGLFINTRSELPNIAGDTSVVYVGFTSPISASTFGTAPFNPFLISNMRRGFEVHLPNNAPTNLIDNTLFNTLDDASKPNAGIYYVTKDNHPWALSFTETFNYPIETVSIDQAYLHFFDWAKSGGTQYTDWYKNTGSGYQNTKNIYGK